MASTVNPDLELTPAQRETLEALLRNESDVAYRRRVKTMLRYLNVQPGDRILDCGTGMAFYPMVLHSLYTDCLVWGCDMEPRVLDFARQHVDQARLLLSRSDIQRMPFADASFDRLIASEIIEHLPDDDRGLAEMYRVLKPGGMLAITVPCSNYPAWYDPINRVAEGLFHRPIRKGPFAGIWANHVRLYTREQIVERIVAAGFEVVQMDMLTHYCFPATQTIVYTFGKGLIDHNLLPGFLAKSTHRFQGTDNKGSWYNPINWVLGLFRWFDHFNENPQRLARKKTFVNVGVLARKPEDGIGE